METSSNAVYPPDCEQDHQGGTSGLQFLAGAHGVSVGSISATTVGRDLHVHHNVTVANPIPGPEAKPLSNEGGNTPAGRAEILEWLDGADFRPVYRAALKQRMADTGIWFLKLPEFKPFIEEKGKVLWASGMPGAGKTILASLSVEHFEKLCRVSPRVAVAFTFIRYSERHTLRDILASILSQLTAGNDTALSHMQTVYGSVTGKSGRDLEEPEMADVLRAIVEELFRVFIIIDGLDEASDDVKDGLLTTLANSGANVLILSRPLDLFTHHTPHAMFVSVQAQGEDIEIYVVDRVKRSSRLKAILHGKPSLVEHLCGAIKERAEGMFLAARLQMESILHTANSVNSIFAVLDTLPSGIDDMYQVTMDRINSQSKEDVHIAHRVFAWLLDTVDDDWEQCQLSTADVQYALAVSLEQGAFNEGDVIPLPLILAACGGLVSVDRAYSWALNKEQPVFRFIHYTTAEFLQKAQLPTIPSDHSIFLGMTCITYVEFHIKKLDSLDAENYLRLRQYLDSHPFLEFSIRNWGHYASLSQMSGTVPEGVHRFLSRWRLYPFFFHHHTRDMQMASGLHLAAMNGLIDVINRQSLPCHPTTSGELCTPFHFAAHQGQFDAFLALILRYQGAHLRTVQGKTFLHLAVDNSHTTFIKKLFNLVDTCSEERLGRILPGFDMNAQDADGRTPLIGGLFARESREDDETALTLLSRKEVRVNICDHDGGSALYYACIHNSPSVVEKLLSSFPNLDMHALRNDGIGSTVLMKACAAGYKGVVNALLNGDSDTCRKLVQQRDTRGKTALSHLVENVLFHTSEPIARLLLDHGADLWVAANGSGRTPFLSVFAWPWELDHGDGLFRTRMVDLFLTYDAKIVGQSDDRGRTALMLAMRNSGYPHTIASILSQPAIDPQYVNRQDMEGHTALMQAIDVDALWQTWSWPWNNEHLGAQRRWRRNIQTLLSLSPSLNLHVRNQRGQTALELICSSPGLSNTTLREFLDDSNDESELLGFQEIVDIFFATLNEIIRFSRSHSWSSELARKATFAAVRTLADPVLCRFLQLEWVGRVFRWSLEEPATVALLLQASRRTCRVGVGMILGKIGLLEGQWDWSSLRAPEGEIAKMYCNAGCLWHSLDCAPSFSISPWILSGSHSLST